MGDPCSKSVKEKVKGTINQLPSGKTVLGQQMLHLLVPAKAFQLGFYLLGFMYFIILLFHFISFIFYFIFAVVQGNIDFPFTLTFFLEGW